MAASRNSKDNVITDQVLVEERSCVRKLILNRPHQLNVLSFQMLTRIRELLKAYEKDQNVKLVIVKGEGKAFCAGGDMAALARAIADGNWRLGAKYFRNAYSITYVIATSSKPQVSILNGIVMGAGSVLSVHGRFRVATENSVFAMPETAIGLFPGGDSYFLSRLPSFFGEYVGLTGARLDGAEMLACGLATHFVPSTTLAFLEEALVEVITTDPMSISATIDEFCQQPVLKKKSVYHRFNIIDKCFSRKTVEEILISLQTEATTSEVDKYWISAAVKSMKKASPVSLKITLRSIRNARLQGVGQCLIQASPKWMMRNGKI